MRIALVHDWLTGMRGGERVLDELARMFPSADLYTLIHVPGSTSAAIDALSIHVSPLSRLPGVARHYRKLLPLFPWAIERFELGGYDLVLSSSHAFAKGVRTSPSTPHLCYCHTPMRYVWDQATAYLGNGLLRTATAPVIAGLRRHDRRTAARVSRFVANSQAVADRVRRHYGRDARVIHPPVDVDRIRPNDKAPEDFFLLVGGFVPYKRDQLAIEAFRRLGRRLIVAGDGPLRARLEATAPANVEFTGRVADEELADLYARCRAVIYPQEEDFGIVAVEAQAAGRPVIAFGRGGATDSVVPLPSEAHDARAPATRAPADSHPRPQAPTQATGLWFDEPSVGAICRAIERFERVESKLDSSVIRAWAERFAPARFRREIEDEIERTMAQVGQR